MQTVSTVPPADRQIGAYRLIRQIGEGGMGTVWLARHAMLERDAAVKLLHSSYSARPEMLTRFFNEARAASSIADPGIVQIFDFGYADDGSAFIVMELLDGEPLDDRLRRHGRLAAADALRIMRQVATSLGAAHARGIIHRDLKPENIFLARDAEVIGGERAKLLDFGIAKLSRDTATGVKTQTAALMGTPTYMSPEQCRGAGEVDQRSDVYAAGCVLYTLVAGEPPFLGEGMGELIALHLTAPAPRASVKAPWISPELDEVIARCLSKDPAARYASGAELAAVLGSLLARTSVMPDFASAMPTMLGSSKTTLSSAMGSVAPAPPRPRRAALTLAGIAAAVAIASVAVAVVARRGSDAEVAVIDAPPAAAMPAERAQPVVAVEPTTTGLDVRPFERMASQVHAGLATVAAWTNAHAMARARTHPPPPKRDPVPRTTNKPTQPEAKPPEPPQPDPKPACPPPMVLQNGACIFDQR